MTVLPPEVLPYLAAVRAALADLTPAERDDLLEDLEGHLAEVAVDTGGELAARLGPPEAYAAELRASAGLPPRQGRGVSLRRRLDGLGHRLLALPGGRAVAAFLPDLRPGWWVLRGWLVVAVAAVLLQGPYTLSRFPLVRFSGSLLLGLLLVGAAVVASVHLGRSGPARWKPLVAVANVVLVLAGLSAAGAVRQEYGVARYGLVGAADPYSSVVRGPNGPINNFYAYDSLGRPLFDIQLFDQDGAPVSDLLLQTRDGRYTRPEYRLGRNGEPLRNVFPRRYTVDMVGPDGFPSTGPLPPPSIPMVALPPEPSPSPSPSQSPSPSP